MFSQATLTILKHSGWAEDRRVDTTNYEAAIENSFPDDVATHTESINSLLSPIGTAHRDHLKLAMALDGKVYSMTDDWLFLIGNSGEEAIEYLCNSRGQANQ